MSKKNFTLSTYSYHICSLTVKNTLIQITKTPKNTKKSQILEEKNSQNESKETQTTKHNEGIDQS